MNNPKQSHAGSTAVKQPQKRYLTWLVVAAYAVLSVVITVGLLATHSSVSSAYPQQAVRVDQPLEVKLSQLLLKVPLDSAVVEPHIDGEWVREQSLQQGNVLRFEHEEPFRADTEYRVTFDSGVRLSGLSAEIPDIVFRTEAAPGVEKVSFADSEVVAADSQFSLQLSDQNRGRRHLKLASSPKVEFELTVTDDKVFTWQPAGLLPQGKALDLQVIDELDGSIVFEKTLKVAAAPGLKSKPAAANFGRDDKAVLVFNDAIDPSSGEISFSVKGSGEWRDEKTFEFIPSAVEPGKSYSYTLPKGLRTKKGGVLTKNQKHSFATPGAVAVVGFSPQGQELSQAHQTIRITFNQPVDKKSAESKVVLSRGSVTSTRWEGNTYVLEAKNFGAQETVQMVVQPGVKPIFGLNSQQSFQGQFTTEIPVKKLNVPMYYQQYAQSCEAANVRMALAYKGVGGLNDWGILQKFGYNPSSHNKKKNLWDDPQQQFVGDVKGDQGAGTGWGVYAEPVAGAVRGYGRQATVQYGVTKSFVAQQIHKGNPVVIWGVWGETAAQRTWKTPDGKKVSGPFPMHVRLVVGVKGKPSNPVGFYIHDPITGPTYWTADYMIQNTQKAGAANQAVAIQ